MTRGLEELADTQFGHKLLASATTDDAGAIPIAAPWNAASSRRPIWSQVACVVITRGPDAMILRSVYGQLAHHKRYGDQSAAEDLGLLVVGAPFGRRSQ